MKFRVTAEVMISVSTLVDAKTERGAIEQASKRGMVSLCRQCAQGEAEQEWVTSGELDGEPYNLRAEEEL